MYMLSVSVSHLTLFFVTIFLLHILCLSSPTIISVYSSVLCSLLAHSNTTFYKYVLCIVQIRTFVVSINTFVCGNFIVKTTIVPPALFKILKSFIALATAGCQRK